MSELKNIHLITADQPTVNGRYYSAETLQRVMDNVATRDLYVQLHSPTEPGQITVDLHKVVGTAKLKFEDGVLSVDITPMTAMCISPVLEYSDFTTCGHGQLVKSDRGIEVEQFDLVYIAAIPKLTDDPEIPE